MMAAIVMFFGALTAAFVFRREFSQTSAAMWKHTPLPLTIWVNTALLAASSTSLEFGRRALRQARRDAFNRHWTAGMAAGLSRANAWPGNRCAIRATW